jgi:hypothetical protein
MPVLLQVASRQFSLRHELVRQLTDAQSTFCGPACVASRRSAQFIRVHICVVFEEIARFAMLGDSHRLVVEKLQLQNRHRLSNALETAGRDVPCLAIFGIFTPTGRPFLHHGRHLAQMDLIYTRHYLEQALGEIVAGRWYMLPSKFPMCYVIPVNKVDSSLMGRLASSQYPLATYFWTSPQILGHWSLCEVLSCVRMTDTNAAARFKKFSSCCCSHSPVCI